LPLPVVWLKPGYLGDAVMALALLDGLSANGRPQVFVGAALRQLYATRKDAMDMLDPPRAKGWGGVFRAANYLRELRPESVLLVNRSFRCALVARLAGVPRRVGHATEGRGLLLTDALPYPQDRKESLCYLDLARLLGFDLPDIPPTLPTTDAEREEAARLLAGATVGLQPGARYRSKRIPQPVLLAIAAELRESGHRIALLGGREERPLAAEFARRLGGEAINLVGETSLRLSLGALANLRLMIGSDTGLMHLSVAVGCPTVTVFGPTSAKKWAHRLPHTVAVEAPGGRLSRVPADAILRAAQSLLSGEGR
jgi:heptosyltransferase-2